MRTGRTFLLATLAAALAIGAAGPAHAADPSPLPTRSGSSQATGRPATEGFATPEDAIREYLAGVAATDVSRILGASAIDEVSDGFDFAASVDRVRAFIPTDTLGPAEHPFYADINRAVTSQRILRKVQVLAFGLLSGMEFDGSVIAPADREWATSFLSQVDPSRLVDLTVEDIRFSDATLEDDTRYLENAAKLARIYGADELTERLVLFSLAGRLYDLGFTLVRYGDGWKVFDQVANLAGTSPLGTAHPTTREEYERATSGES